MKRRTPLRRNPMRRRPPEHASNIRPEQRAAALLRDQSRCGGCGVLCIDIPSALHHRKLRSRGGDDRLSNLVLLCSGDPARGRTGCHADLHANVMDAEADGFILRSGEDSEAVPVLTWLGWRHYMDSGDVLTRSEYLGRPA